MVLIASLFICLPFLQETFQKALLQLHKRSGHRRGRLSHHKLYYTTVAQLLLFQAFLSTASQHPGFRDTTGNTKFFFTLIFSSKARTLYAIAERYAASTFSFGHPARSKPAASDFAKTTQVELTGGGSSATWNERSPTSCPGSTFVVHQKCNHFAFVINLNNLTILTAHIKNCPY